MPVQNLLGEDSWNGRPHTVCFWLRGLDQEVRLSRHFYYVPEHSGNGSRSHLNIRTKFITVSIDTQEETLCELLGLVDENTVNQWIAKNGWKSGDNGFVLISNQEESIKTKKITEKIDLESVAGIMASCY